MKKFKMGWIPDLPDIRDLKLKSSKVKSLLKKTKYDAIIQHLPAKADLSPWFSPVEDQGDIGSCTAQSGCNLLEYYMSKTHGKHIECSRLFLYKTTRNLMGLDGDTGAYLRDTMKAMAMFGVPPEKHYPYETEVYDDEPKAFHYSLAQNYQALEYYRLDYNGVDHSELLESIKGHIAVGFPSMFGFTVFESLYDPMNEGEIPFPDYSEYVYGGHAVVAVGYDDDKEIKNPYTAVVSKGAFKIKNSWGKDWGDEGYGWLPYEYVEYGLAEDWWILVSNEWLDTGVFN